MNCLILAAGFATRLYPLTEKIPKALIEINNKTILSLILKKIEEIEGINNIYIVTNNKHHNQFNDWLNRNRQAKKITLLNNNVNSIFEKKGAIPDLKLALSHIKDNDDLFILASDNLFDFSLNELTKLRHSNNSSVVALKTIDNIKLIKKYSCVLLDSNNKITKFEEKPPLPFSNICATACYLIKKEDIQKIKSHDFKHVENMGSIVDFLTNYSELHGKIFDEFWVDIGSREDLERAEMIIKKPL